MATKKAGGGSLLRRALSARSGSSRRMAGKSADRVRGKPRGEDVGSDLSAKPTVDEMYDVDPGPYPGVSKHEIESLPVYDKDGNRIKRGGRIEVGKVGGKKSGGRLDKKRRR